MKSVWSVIRRLSYKNVPRPEAFASKDSPVQDRVPLMKLLEAKIKAKGPISVAEYMKTVLTSPQEGYYMNRDVFGKKGDFVTSPEVSPLFGEIVAAWILNELNKIGNPRPLQLIEFGPGRGTLTSDILRVLKHFQCLEGLSVHLVELSPALSAIQAGNLCTEVVAGGGFTVPNTENTYYRCGATEDGVPVYWYNKIEDVPRGFCVVLAHEFFDALPIHKFQKTKEGWREVLISTKLSNGSLELDYVLSNDESPISKLLIKANEPRDHLELSPKSGAIAKHMADRIEEEGGFILIVDYGHVGEKTDTFRAFKNHQLHNPLVDPGSADLTADVDFSFLKEVMQEKLLVFGPTNQGKFLQRLGIETRLKQLVKTSDKETAEILTSACKMLTSEEHMGARFKFFAGFPKVLKDHLNKFPVAGFHA